MTESFFSYEEGDALAGGEWTRGFLPPAEGRRYETELRDLARTRLKGTDAKLFSLIATYPLISRACVRDAAGEAAEGALDGLFRDGVLARFCEIDRNGDGEGRLTRSVYHVSKAAEGLCPRGFSGFSHAPSVIDQMTGARRAELSAVSEYAARACHGAGGGRLLSLAPPGRDRPWTEALIQKRTAPSAFGRGARCLFHVVKRPLERDRLPAFLETLHFLNERTLAEEREAGPFPVRSRAVILCDSDDDMERFAAYLNKFLGSRHLETESAERFLYALEGDARDRAGAFKFFSRITFEEGTIKKSQVAYR